MRISTLSLFIGVLILSACGKAPPPQVEKAPPFVKTVKVATGGAADVGLSGTVRARVESPLAFQVGGRIARRAVDAGERVAAGQALFQLDTHDFEQGVRAAAADLAAADAALATAEADLLRARQLQQRNYTSEQAIERFELARREAHTRHEAAAARLVQARNALGYARLQAPQAGVLVDVVGEPGQVVAVGQQVALLAQTGERELEVHFPASVTPPAEGLALLGDGTTRPLALRETAGAVERQGRTLRARYTVHGTQDGLVLGAVLRARFRTATVAEGEFVVPLGALNERGEGARVWRVRDGAVSSVPVGVQSTDGEMARVRGALADGDTVVALGTHLLTEGMKVRELAR
ncbi:efflux RND transporter periplasmic adaptor subunit [Thauera linaloolentis]|uniref:RND family efflux transporter MFP subunit n=1 Tax=Thauera linaloolentis (strain DSM 12138 / JCM 21573 / CCUG 41526 / CIP 105981 / IAM 15112 / NBRC 102519 / 47Lol) TaxID=1123367 RepID=N6YYA8_THAL4|nr:efflux RND transporter periplasmic adaptor subunit [Thauera linaloolentis]ENO87143.1 RND family efflux transporter MFP subunit [Thauera linaloolentis 47Lol = DSM 12138]MCM8566410.1 efflux RND transporter periplasmic adaptor subunit [Thauera linaloolentis]